MSAKINKHVFHGIYSNGYIPYNIDQKRFANFPIHFFRASSAELQNDVIKEFETEQDVLEWYKKNEYGESQYNELEDFCKNYIIFPESEFHKYRSLFHGMIKGLKVTSDIEVQSRGQAAFPECPPCEGDEEDAANTPPKTSTYSQRLKFSINFDSTKIFDFGQLQKRLPANNFNYRTEVDLQENKNIEELISISNSRVFKDEWSFDQESLKSIFQSNNKKFNFNATFINDPVIVQNSDDPLRINISNSFKSSRESTEENLNKQRNFSKTFDKFNSINCQLNATNSIVYSASHSLDFKINGLFYIKKTKNYICFVEIDNTISFGGDVIDKPEECPECSSSSSGSPPDNQSPGGLSVENIDLILSHFFEKSDSNVPLILSTEANYSYLGPTNRSNIEFALSTNDLLNDGSRTYFTSSCGDNLKKLEFVKTKCLIKILNSSYGIELYKLKDNQFSYDNSDCEDVPLAKNTIQINYNKMPSFEILEWKNSDFDKKNIFPPKLV